MDLDAVASVSVGIRDEDRSVDARTEGDILKAEGLARDIALRRRATQPSVRARCQILRGTGA
jgi:hypothetical protein